MGGREERVIGEFERGEEMRREHTFTGAQACMPLLNPPVKRELEWENNKYLPILLSHFIL